MADAETLIRKYAEATTRTEASIAASDLSHRLGVPMDAVEPETPGAVRELIAGLDTGRFTWPAEAVSVLYCVVHTLGSWWRAANRSRRPDSQELSIAGEEGVRALLLARLDRTRAELRDADPEFRSMSALLLSVVSDEPDADLALLRRHLDEESHPCARATLIEATLWLRLRFVADARSLHAEIEGLLTGGDDMTRCRLAFGLRNQRLRKLPEPTVKALESVNLRKTGFLWPCEV